MTTALRLLFRIDRVFVGPRTSERASTRLTFFDIVFLLTSAGHNAGAGRKISASGGAT